MKNLPYADFELNVDPAGANEQHLFRLSGIGQMPLHKKRNTIWCVLSGQNEGGGGMRSSCSKKQQQYGDNNRDCFGAAPLMLHMTHQLRRCVNGKHGNDMRLCYFKKDIMPFRNDKRY